jgi:thiamine kinase-like enzyme
LIKVDGSGHGDDHFFPGPADIAWDLAGAIVEWNMDRDAEEYLLGRFRLKSGICPTNVPAFVLAYSVFRACYCKMSLTGTSVESEKPRLRSAYLFYRNKMDATLRNIDAAASGVRL